MLRVRPSMVSLVLLVPFSGWVFWVLSSRGPLPRSAVLSVVALVVGAVVASVVGAVVAMVGMLVGVLVYSIS